MKTLAAIAALSASALAMTTAVSLADYTLNILHINDWHSHIESINKYDSTCSAEDEQAGECFGGAARLATAVRERREALDGRNVLFLNAGDNFQGSLFYTTYKGAVEAEFLNLMGTDAMAVGNHEFDDGEEGPATFLEAAEFPVLSTNVEVSEGSVLGDRVDPYVVLDVGGQKIGIVGAVANDTDELSSPGEHVTIADDVETITAAVDELVGQGVDKIIALTHVGYPRDLEAIAKIPGVDVVVGGHSHTLLSNTIEGAAGPYPTMVENPEGYEVPVVQAGAYSKYLGELQVTFSDAGIVTEASGEPILLDASFEPDPQVAARVADLAAPIEELKAQVVSETTAPIDGSRESCRARECEMGNLVTDAMLERVKSQGMDFAITNGGGLRASIDEGDVTKGEVLEVLPFQNTLSTFQLSGADVVAALENGVSQIEDGAGRFPQVAGLRYSFDPSAAPNEGRVVSVQVGDGESWAPIDPDATYGVVSNNFMRAGGDGYSVFAEKAENAYDYGPGLEQVVADYLAENRPYTPHLDNRITEVAATVAGADADAESTDDAIMSKDEEDNAAKAGEETTVSEDGAAIEGEAEQLATEEEGTGLAEGEATAAKENAHTIVAGDTYWDLAAEYYGDPTMWNRLADANPGMAPRALRIGATLAIPPAN